eukprot:2474182-Rhodomonas_salina.1
MSDSDSHDKRDGHKNLTFCAWMGQHSWKEWKQQARSDARKKQIVFIPKLAQFIFNAIKQEIDPTRGRNIHNPSRILKTNIEDYDDTYWLHKFEKNNLFIDITDEKVNGLQVRKLMVSKWQDVGYNLCRDQSELEKKQLWKTDMWFSARNRLYIEMIRDSIASCTIKPKPKCLDILEGLVSTPDIDEEILDENWDREWVMAPWKQPAIKIW